MGGSAPCSKIGLAHVRKDGDRWMKSGLKYRPCPCLGHATPGAGTGKATLPAHSPNMAHACIQSSGVLAVQPRSGVRSSPPCRASDGSTGTAEVKRKSVRLAHNLAIHSVGDLRSAGVAIRRDLGALGSHSSAVVPWSDWSDDSPDGAASPEASDLCTISTSAVGAGICPVTTTRPAFSSALDSVIKRTSGESIHHSLSATQECRDTNCTTRTNSNGWTFIWWCVWFLFVCFLFALVSGLLSVFLSALTPWDGSSNSATSFGSSFRLSSILTGGNCCVFVCLSFDSVPHFIVSCWFYCGRFALLAWGSAFRLFAVGHFFDLPPRSVQAMEGKKGWTFIWVFCSLILGSSGTPIWTGWSLLKNKKWRRPPMKRTFSEVCFQSISGKLLLSEGTSAVTTTTFS